MFLTRHHHRPAIDRNFLLPCHHSLAAAVDEFADHEIRGRVPDWESSTEIEHDLVREIARLGWIGAGIPTTYGGSGMDHRSKVIIVERLSRVCGAIGAATQASDIPVAIFEHIATPAQREHWLPRLAGGRCLATIAATEPHSGGWVLGMDTSAECDGEDYLLTGRKSFIGNSHIADVHAVIARTGERELSAFVVESGTRGLTLVPHTATLGLHGFSLGDLELDRVRVPVDARLGSPGDGFDAAYLASIVHGRLDIAAVALGLHTAILDTTVDYAGPHTRLARHETVQQRIGTIQSNWMTAKLAVYHAAWLLDHDADCDAELINAKLIAVERGIDSARLAHEIFGARALRTTEPIERLVRDIQHLWAPAGTGDVQRYRLWHEATGRTKSSWSERVSHPPSVHD